MLVGTSMLLATNQKDSVLPALLVDATTNAPNDGWRGICWSDDLNLFCAVSNSGSGGGRVATSPDGQIWTKQASATGSPFAVCWSPDLSLFCAVGQNGTILTSPDGANWTSRTSPEDEYWRAVCWSPGAELFCAVGGSSIDGGAVMTSPDGITWTSRTSASPRGWNGVCWSPDLSLFCAVGSGDTIEDAVMTSPDGITWTSRTGTLHNTWQSVCWAPELSLFCAVGADFSGGLGNIMTSPDGTNWTARGPLSVPLNSVCWAPEIDRFCAVGRGDFFTDAIATSPDGVNWERHPDPGNGWPAVCWAPLLESFAAVSFNGSGNRTMTIRRRRAATQFDGSTSYLTRGGNLTGLSAGREFFFAGWLKMNGGDGTLQLMLAFYDGAAPNYKASIQRVNIASTDVLRATLVDASNSVVFQAAWPGSFTSADDWTHFMCAVNLDTGEYWFRRNGVTVTPSIAVAPVAADIDYGVTDVLVGALAGGSGQLVDGSMAELFFHPAWVPDSDAFARKFVNTHGQPKDLGANGEKPLGAAPLLYLSGPTSSFAGNKGTGGAFTVIGTLTAAPSSPSDIVPAL